MARVWIGDARPRRGRVTAFISDHLAAWETAMAALSIAYLALAVRADNAPRSVPDAALLAFSGLFLAEFAVRCFDAPSRWRYFRAHWLDLLSCIPLVGGLRAIRLVRLVRLAAGIRVLAVMEDTADQRAGGRESLWFLVPSVASIWIGSSYAVWEVEHGINPHLQSFADALYWSFTTATTVGYGDIRPVTPTGRLIAGLLVFVSIGLIGLTSSRLTAMWMHQAGKPIQPLMSWRRFVRSLLRSEHSCWKSEPVHRRQTRSGQDRAVQGRARGRVTDWCTCSRLHP